MKNKIKIVYGIVCFVFCFGHMQGQNREIRFEAGSFPEALAKAQQGNKYLFMDCYTAWCGPCKLLAKNVFTLDSVADFFNSHFVNFSIDMEKGEGVDLQKKYKIEAYPTLLLIDGNGQEVFRLVGGCSAGVLMSRFRVAMDPGNAIAGMEKAFAAGERDPLFVGKYWKALQEGRQFVTLQESTATYFKGMNVPKICQEQNWNLYHQYVDIDNPLHHLMIDHLKEFKKLKGVKLIEDKLSKEYDFAIMGRIPNVGHTEAQVKQYADDIEKIDFQNKEQLFYLQSYLKIAQLKVAKQYDQYLDFMENGLTNFSFEEKTRAILSLLMLADANLEQRKRGNQLLVKVAKAVMERNNGTLPVHEQQMFGFIQHKLSGKE